MDGDARDPGHAATRREAIGLWALIGLWLWPFCGPCLYRLKPHILNFGEFFMDRQILDKAPTLPMPLRGGGLWF